MKIEYYKKNVYGNEMPYIKDKEVASAMHRLIGTKTISPTQMMLVTSLFSTEFIQVLN